MTKIIEVIDHDDFIELLDNATNSSIRLDTEDEVLAVIRLLVKTVRDKNIKRQLARLLTVEEL